MAWKEKVSFVSLAARHPATTRCDADWRELCLCSYAPVRGLPRQPSAQLAIGGRAGQRAVEKLQRFEATPGRKERGHGLHARPHDGGVWNAGCHQRTTQGSTFTSASRSVRFQKYISVRNG